MVDCMKEMLYRYVAKTNLMRIQMKTKEIENKIIEETYEKQKRGE